MQLQARTRLLTAQQAEVDAVSYDVYAQAISSLDPSYVMAFGFSMPKILKGLTSDLGKVAEYLKEAADIGLDAIIQAFKEKSVFALLKGLGFSLSKLIKGVQTALSIPAHALFTALDDVIQTFGNAESFKKLKVKERLEKLDQLTHRHPVLTKLTGFAVAGFLLWSYLHASNTGDVSYDLGIVDSIVNCIRGKYDLVDLFGSPDGVKAICVLLFGVATGGIGITTYGVNSIEKGLSFLGSHSGSASSIMLALFYAAAKKLHLRIDQSMAPKELRGSDEDREYGRHQTWFHKLSPEEQKRYRAKYPGTKFVDQTKLVVPE